MRIAINGMGRIGRLLFRRLAEHKDLELVAVNDIMPADNLVYLLKYDSVYGTFVHDIVPDEDHISCCREKNKDVAGRSSLKTALEKIRY